MAETIIDESAIRLEVEALHAFFASWFSGCAPLSEDWFESEFSRRFDDEFILIQPNGNSLNKDALANVIRKGYRSNPDFRVAIRNLKLHRKLDGYALATYEEWQRNARAPQPVDNGRLSTVLIGLEIDRMRWLHVHETWLPADVMKAGPYDF